MPKFIVTAYVNVGEDHFLGWQPHHAIAAVGTFHVDAPNALHAAHAMWSVGNKVAPDARGQHYPHDVRSLSVGDLLAIKQPEEPGVTFYAIASIGFVDIPEPTNRIVPLEGTDATSRPART